MRWRFLSWRFAPRLGLWVVAAGLASALVIVVSTTGLAQEADASARASAVGGAGANQLGPQDAERAKDQPEAAPGSAQTPASPTAAPKAAVASLAVPAPPAREDIIKHSLPPRSPGARMYYRSIIEKEAAHTGLPPQIAEAVMEVESGFNPAVIGGAGEIGLMQLMPPTARMLGFSGSLSELAQPETNIHYGVRYLAQAWRLAGGDVCTATMKYRAGHGETRFSQLSVNYCVAVRSKLAARGYPVTGLVPMATFGAATTAFIGTASARPFTRLSIGGGPLSGPPRLSLRAAAPCRTRCLTALGGSQPNFDGINNSLNQLVMQSNVRAIRLR